MVSYFTVLNFEYSFDAVVCDPISVERAIQSTTESIVANAVSCDGNTSDCISYNSFVQIISNFKGMCYNLSSIICV